MVDSLKKRGENRGGVVKEKRKEERHTGREKQRAGGVE